MTPRTSRLAARSGQRRRTRQAIVAAAAELLGRGLTPSVAEVAEVAEVSRRTVYMYFPTLEQLFIDATLAIVAGKTIEGAIGDDDSDGDAEARVERMARTAQQMAATTEQEGRALMRLTADARVDGRPGGRPPRGYRRIEWIERALAPVRSQLDAPRFERLVSALAMVIGWEALIVQRDIRALSLKEAEDVSAWAARALVKATLDELRRAKRSRGVRGSRRKSGTARRDAAPA
jgi:AcrR family transcriptional regulator